MVYVWVAQGRTVHASESFAIAGYFVLKTAAEKEDSLFKRRSGHLDDRRRCVEKYFCRRGVTGRGELHRGRGSHWWQVSSRAPGSYSVGLALAGEDDECACMLFMSL